MNKKLPYLHVRKCFSHGIYFLGDQNHWNDLNSTLALNSTEHTHTVRWKTVKAATGCGIHRLGVTVFHTTCTFQYYGWMSMRMHSDFSDVYSTTPIVTLWGSSRSWTAARCGRVAKVCLLFCTLVFRVSLCRVNQSSTVREYGVDAWRVGKWRMTRIRQRRWRER